MKSFKDHIKSQKTELEKIAAEIGDTPEKRHMYVYKELRKLDSKKRWFINYSEDRILWLDSEQAHKILREIALTIDPGNFSASWELIKDSTLDDIEMYWHEHKEALYRQVIGIRNAAKLKPVTLNQVRQLDLELSEMTSHSQMLSAYEAFTDKYGTSWGGY